MDRLAGGLDKEGRSVADLARHRVFQADVGGLILLISLLAGGFGVYRLRVGSSSLLKITLVLSIVLLAAYVVAAWAMAGKPN